MEGEERARQAVKLFELGEDRDILNECPRPCRRLGVVLGCPSSFFGTKLSVYKGNFVFVLVDEACTSFWGQTFPRKLLRFLFVVQQGIGERLRLLLGGSHLRHPRQR